jgi:hypothetical protein
MALALSVPAATQNSPKGLETRPKHAKAWIESLPLTKTIQSGRTVCEHLSELNRARFPAEERLELMEIYHPVLATLLDELEHVFASSQLPLPAKQREAFDLAHDLARECAYAYKHCILDKTNKLIAFGARRSLPLPIYRAMAHLRQLLVQSYMTYSPVAAGIWRELNHLYAYCEEQEMLEETPDSEIDASIQDLYMDAVLLSLADPYRLMQREAEKVLDLLAQNRGLAALGPKPGDDTDPNRTFAVALDSDRAPRLLSSALKDPAGEDLRTLNIGGLLDALKQRSQSQAGKARTPDGAADLIGRLTRLWGDPPKRQFRRNPAETSVALCSGIKAIAHFADLGEKEDPKAEAAAIQSGTTMPQFRIPTDAVSKQVGVEEWTVLNQSATGLRLHREPGGVGIAVGEATGVRFIGGRGWNIGVVRWLNMLENNDLEFGLELISPSAHPIQIEPTIASNGRAQAALQLPSMIQDDETESLLTFPDTFSDLREFELDDGGESRLVRATTLVEKTSRFELFQFTAS